MNYHCLHWTDPELGVAVIVMQILEASRLLFGEIVGYVLEDSKAHVLVNFGSVWMGRSPGTWVAIWRFHTTAQQGTVHGGVLVASWKMGER